MIASARDDKCIERNRAEQSDPAAVDGDGDDGGTSAAPAAPQIDAEDDSDEAGEPDGDSAEGDGGTAPEAEEAGANIGDGGNSEGADSSQPRDAGDQESGVVEMPDGALAGEGGRTVFQPPASPWQSIAGAASMIAVGANGDVWSLGTTLISSHGYSVFKRVGEDWIEVQSDGAVNLAVDPSGIPWILDTNGQLSRGSDSSVHASWGFFGSYIADVAFSAQGDMWVLGQDRIAYRVLNGSFDSGGDSFSLAWRLAVNPTGVPWIVDSPERIFERASSSPNQLGWILRHGTAAADVSIAPDGAVFVLGDALGPGGRLVKYLNGDQAWVPLDETVGGVSIAAGPSDLWMVDAQRKIYRCRRADIR